MGCSHMDLNTSVRKIVIAIGIDTAVTLLAIPLEARQFMISRKGVVSKVKERD